MKTNITSTSEQNTGGSSKSGVKGEQTTPKRQVLVADVGLRTRTAVSHALAREGFEVHVAKKRSHFIKWLRAGTGGLIGLDESFFETRGGSIEGHDALLNAIQTLRPRVPVIVIGEAQNTGLSSHV